MTHKNGGLAFPQSIAIGPSDDIYVSDGFKDAEGEDAGGMSLRDYFAAAVVPAVTSSILTTESGAKAALEMAPDPQEAIAICTYRVADAMLAEREKGK